MLKGHSGALPHKEALLSQAIKFHIRSLARVKDLLSFAPLPHAWPLRILVIVLTIIAFI